MGEQVRGTMTGKRNERRLYNDLAHLWHLVSPLEDYLEETEFFCDLIKRESTREVKTLLHLGCGRGHNDYVFKRHFTVTGIDSSKAMLDWARTLNPENRYLEGDMCNVRLDSRFDAVAAVDSVDYLYKEEDLRTLFRNAFDHVNTGGIFMFILDDTRESFRQNDTVVYSNSSGDELVTVIENKYDPNSDDTEYEMTFVYLYRRAGYLEIFTDRHLCGLFHESVVKNLLTEAGFRVKIVDYHPPESAFGNMDSMNKETYPLFLAFKPGKNLT